MSITAYENLISTAERRLLITHDTKTAVRMSDFLGVITAINGKIELVYEGEQEGAAEVAQLLIDEAVQQKFGSLFPPIQKLEKEGVPTPYTATIEWFNTNSFLEIGNYTTDAVYRKNLDSVTPLKELVTKFCPTADKDNVYFYMEMVLWALSINNKLDRIETETAFTFENNELSKNFYGSN